MNGPQKLNIAIVVIVVVVEWATPVVAPSPRVPSAVSAESGRL